MKFRMERINLEIKNNISKIIYNMSNSKLQGKFITIADVKTSPDLYYCKVLISMFGSENKKREIPKPKRKVKTNQKEETA